MLTASEAAALILCAGRSSRMGDFKPLLPLGPDNLLGRSVSLFRRAGVSDILVVLGHVAGRVIPLLDALAVRWVVNEDYDAGGMFSSVQTGVGRFTPPCRAFFLQPVDLPLVQAGTIRALLAAYAEGETAVCRPCYEGRAGHPPLISLALAGVIGEYNGAGGLRAVLSRYREKTRDVACGDPGVLLDIDTPADYARALQMLPGLPQEQGA